MANKESQYSIKDSDVAFMMSVNESFQKVMTSYLIVIASERFGYKVTANTQFAYNLADKTLKISEAQAEPDKSAVKTAK